MLTLTSQAARVALILSMIDTMKTPLREQAPLQTRDLEALLENEVQKRPRTRPCVAEGRAFPSTIEAARYLAHHRRDLWENSAAAMRQDAHAVMENLRNRVKRYCNDDYRNNARVGYYWI